MIPVISTFEAPPLFLLVIHQWMKHPEWMAPRGRYIPGKEYSLFSGYNLVGIAIIAAAMTASGLICSPLFDLPIFFAWIASFYFNPWIAGWGTAISIFLRYTIWEGNSPIYSFGAAYFDFWAYSTISLLTLYILEPRRGRGIKMLPYYALVVIMSQVVQRILGTWHYVMWNNPGPAYLPACWMWLVLYTLGPGWSTAAVALAVSESAIKATISYARRPR